MQTSRLMAATVVAAMAILGIPATSYAWNLICGVSIGLMAHQQEFAQHLQANPQPQAGVLSDKWDADSRALRGISFYYLALSELQRVEIGQNGNFTNPTSLDGTGSATSIASGLLGKSANEFDLAIQTATKNNLGDEQGLALLNSMKSQAQTMADEMNNGKHLPNLDEVQKLAQVINQFTAHGIELSRTHLAQGLPGHGMGGAQFQLK